MMVCLSNENAARMRRHGYKEYGACGLREALEGSAAKRRRRAQ